jgi:hypothetical protein
MFKLLSAAALMAVSANAEAAMPVFSSNDDYDEINLNIRLLSGHGNHSHADMESSNKTSFVVKGDLITTYPTELTIKALCSAVEGPTEVALKESLTADKAHIKYCDDSDHEHEGHDHRRRQLSGSKSILQVYELSYDTQAAANTATATITSGTFAATFATSLNSALAAAPGASGLTATVAADAFKAPVIEEMKGGKPVTTAAPPAATPAAPAPSPSSDASMVKTNVAVSMAGVAALVASLF